MLLLFAVCSWAQEVPEAIEEKKESPPWRDKVFFGAGGGLQLSNIGTYISVFPSVGYRIAPKLSAGVTGAYQYVHYRDLDRNAHNYGASLFSRYFVLSQVYATAEYELMSLELTGFNFEQERRWVDRMLVGAGYFQGAPGGNGGGFYIGILYDLFYTSSDPGYPYQSPFVYRVGVTF